MAMPTMSEYREADKARIGELEDALRYIILVAREATKAESKRLAEIEYIAGAALILI